MFKVIDDDGEGQEADFLGQAEATLGMIMGARAQTFTVNLTGNRSGKATLIVRSEAVAESNDAVKMEF